MLEKIPGFVPNQEQKKEVNKPAEVDFAEGLLMLKKLLRRSQTENNYEYYQAFKKAIKNTADNNRPEGFDQFVGWTKEDLENLLAQLDQAETTATNIENDSNDKILKKAKLIAELFEGYNGPQTSSVLEDLVALSLGRLEEHSQNGDLTTVQEEEYPGWVKGDFVALLDELSKNQQIKVKIENIKDSI